MTNNTSTDQAGNAEDLVTDLITSYLTAEQVKEHLNYMHNVVVTARHLGWGGDRTITAIWLHLAVESLGMSLDYVKNTFGKSMAEAVGCAVQDRGENLGSVVDRVKDNQLARKVLTAVCFARLIDGKDVERTTLFATSLLRLCAAYDLKDGELS